MRTNIIGNILKSNIIGNGRKELTKNHITFHVTVLEYGKWKDIGSIMILGK